jgi:hypothetical protein
MGADVGAFEPGFSDFLSLTLNHGVGSVEDGGPLIPFVLAESKGQRQLQRFALERLEESVKAAFAFASVTHGEADRVAVAFDGFLTWEGERTDAIYVETLDRPTATHVLVAQRYKPKRRLSKLKKLRDPVFLDAEANGKLR